MGRHPLEFPSTATPIRTYAQLGEFVRAFCKGKQPLLMILGSPGLGKSQTLRNAVGGSGAAYIKGAKSPPMFHCDIYNHQNLPIVIDG